MTIIEDTPVKNLTDEQLAFALANRRAIANTDPPPPLEWETRERTAEDRAYRFCQWARSWGAADAEIGPEIYNALVGIGYSDAAAMEVLQDIGIIWKPRTTEERLVHVAAEMLESGWSEVEVTWAIDGLVSDGR
jgi:hypothetical protein